MSQFPYYNSVVYEVVKQELENGFTTKRIKSKSKPSSEFSIQYDSIFDESVDREIKIHLVLPIEKIISAHDNKNSDYLRTDNRVIFCDSCNHYKCNDYKLYLESPECCKETELNLQIISDSVNFGLEIPIYLCKQCRQINLGIEFELIGGCHKINSYDNGSIFTIKSLFFYEIIATLIEKCIENRILNDYNSNKISMEISMENKYSMKVELIKSNTKLGYWFVNKIQFQ